MNYKLFAITSSLHQETDDDVLKEPFIQELQKELKGELTLTSDCSEADMIYVRTGGTESRFKEIYPQLRGDIRLLTSGQSNSLAASVEILSWLNQQGRCGEILHGSAGYIAKQLVSDTPQETAVRLRLGVIGKSSDWLISSDPDRDALRRKLGIELVDIDIRELIDETQKKEYTLPEGMSINRDFNNEVLEGALHIYGAMKRIIERENLQGVTVRCFDLLGPLKNTGCLALALLNAEGIPAACEGDIPALVTMVIGKQVTGVCGFQANPSRIDAERNEIVLAHCTAPLNILRRYCYDTHFESGIGVAIHGEMEEGEVTVFKTSPDLSRVFLEKGTLLKNLNERNLCRTQLLLHLDGAAEYFLHHPIGNHHVILPGNHVNEIKKYIDSL